jgi:hypothetical protein
MGAPTTSRLHFGHNQEGVGDHKVYTDMWWHWGWGDYLAYFVVAALNSVVNFQAAHELQLKQNYAVILRYTSLIQVRLKRPFQCLSCASYMFPYPTDVKQNGNALFPFDI